MGCKVKELRFGLHKCRTPVFSNNMLIPALQYSQQYHPIERLYNETHPKSNKNN